MTLLKAETDAATKVNEINGNGGLTEADKATLIEKVNENKNNTLTAIEQATDVDKVDDALAKAEVSDAVIDSASDAYVTINGLDGVKDDDKEILKGTVEDIVDKSIDNVNSSENAAEAEEVMWDSMENIIKTTVEGALGEAFDSEASGEIEDIVSDMQEAVAGATTPEEKAFEEARGNAKIDAVLSAAEVLNALQNNAGLSADEKSELIVKLEEAKTYALSTLTDATSAEEIALAVTKVDALYTLVESAADAYASVGEQADLTNTESVAAKDDIRASINAGIEAVKAAIDEMLVDKAVTEAEDAVASRVQLAITQNDFNAYKEELTNKLDSIAGANDSQAVTDLIAAAKNAVENVVFDASKSLNDQKTELDALCDPLEEGIYERRIDDYKAKVDALIGATDGANVTAAVAEVKAEMDALVKPTEEQIKQILDDAKAIIATERFKDQTAGGDDVLRKEFGDIKASDIEAIEKAIEEYNKLDDETKAYLDSMVEAPYVSFLDELEDRLACADFVLTKENTADEVESFLREHDGEFVKDINKAEVDKILSMPYEQQTEAERAAYVETIKELVAQAQETAVIATKQAQSGQIAVNNANSDHSEKTESGQYTEN